MKAKYIVSNAIALLTIASISVVAVAAQPLTGTWTCRFDNSQDYNKTVYFSTYWTTEEGTITLSQGADAKTVFYPGASGNVFEAVVQSDKNMDGGLKATVTFTDQNGGDGYTNYCNVHLIGTPQAGNRFVYIGTASYENHGDMRCSGPRFLGVNGSFTVSVNKR